MLAVGFAILFGGYTLTFYGYGLLKHTGWSLVDLVVPGRPHPLASVPGYDPNNPQSGGYSQDAQGNLIWTPPGGTISNPQQPHQVA